MSHPILIPTHKYKFKKIYLNPRWGISFKLGQILRCISKIMGRLPWGIDSRRDIQARAPEVEIKGGPIGLERARWKKRGNEERKKKASAEGVYGEGHQPHWHPLTHQGCQPHWRPTVHRDAPQPHGPSISISGGRLFI
jgi:hypothetical protein